MILDVEEREVSKIFVAPDEMDRVRNVGGFVQIMMWDTRSIRHIDVFVAHTYHRRSSSEVKG